MPNDETKLLDFNDPDAIPGVIFKQATVKALEITDDDMKAINKYSLTPLKSEDVFVFKATFADNEQDDRNFAPFNRKALQDLKKLYPGKTVLKDHNRVADNQIGRVYATELVQDESRKTALGEVHTELIGKVYMVKTAGNADLISEISGGIKKEVSTSCIPEKMICSICGCDNMKDWCRHWPGKEYDVTDQATGKASKRVCTMLLSGAKEAYEVSLVAVPAQPRAGAHKCVGFAKPVEAKAHSEPEEAPEVSDTKGSDELGLRVKLGELFSFHSHLNNKKED